MKVKSAAIHLLTLAAPLVLLATSQAQAEQRVPDAPSITNVTRSCADDSTMLFLDVMRYDARTKTWGPAEGVQTLVVQGRGGSPDDFHDWTSLASVTTDPSDGGGWIGWERGVRLPFQFRLVMADGTISEAFAMPDECTKPA